MQPKEREDGGIHEGINDSNKLTEQGLKISQVQSFIRSFTSCSGECSLVDMQLGVGFTQQRVCKGLNTLCCWICCIELFLSIKVFTSRVVTTHGNTCCGLKSEQTV